MTADDINRNIAELEESFGRVKTLLAWQKLKQDEFKRNFRSNLRMYDSAHMDLKDEFLSFHLRLCHIYGLLKRKTGSLSQLRKRIIMTKINAMETDLRFLNVMSYIRAY